MRIGIVCYPTYGGSGVVATELGRTLAEKGYTVHFIAYQQPVRLVKFSPPVYFHEVAVSEYPLFEFPPFELALTSKMIQVAKDEKLDLLHVHYAIPHASSAYMAKQILLKENILLPYITTLHGTDITIVGKEPELEPVITFSINQSDKVTAVSHYLKEETCQHFNIQKEIHVIPNFICLKEIESATADIELKKHIAPNGEPILTHISNFRKVKRIDDVIRIFSAVRKHLPAKLLMIGDGPERNAAASLAKDLQVNHDIHFVGKLKETFPALKISDLFLLPSASESFGLSALEAMACGVPVIGTQAGGLPEVVVHEKTGFLHPIGDIDSMSRSALQLLQYPSLYQNMRKNCHLHAQQYSSRNIVPLYEQLYQQLLSEQNKTI